jgi:superfamily I DNA/RNA helicase
MSEKDKKDRIEEKTITQKTEIIGNTNSQVANFQLNQIDTNRIEEKTIIEKTEIISDTDFQANQIDTLSLFNITKFKEYQILKQLEIFSNFSDLFLTKKEDKYYILKLYRMAIKLDDLVLSRVKSINSELIVNIIDYGFNNQLKRYYIIEEYYSLGSLSNFIKNNYELIRNNYKVIDSIVNQLNEGIYLLHKNEILHKDIKSSNILIKEIIKNKHGGIEDIKVVISDFNISSIIPTEASKVITEEVKGTIVYMAPERFSKVITKKSDYWSLGMILYELLFKNLPFENIDTNIVKYKIFTEDIQISKEIPIKYQILLRGLFIRKPEKRFYYKEVKDIINTTDELKIKQVYEEYIKKQYPENNIYGAVSNIYQDKSTKEIVYKNNKYKSLDDLINQEQIDEEIFYSLLELIENKKYKDILSAYDIKLIEKYKSELKDDIKLALSLYISYKKENFYLYGIKIDIDKDNLKEIIKKHFEKQEQSLTPGEYKILELINNYINGDDTKLNIINIYSIYIDEILKIGNENIRFFEWKLKKLWNDYILTPEQKDIVSSVEKYNRIKVEALAGTGKTTTILAIILNYAELCIKKRKKILVLTFNRAIANEIQDKIKKERLDGVAEAKTVHSLALRYVKKILFPNQEIDPKDNLDPEDINRLLDISSYQSSDIIIKVFEAFCKSNLTNINKETIKQVILSDFQLRSEVEHYEDRYKEEYKEKISYFFYILKILNQSIVKISPITSVIVSFYKINFFNITKFFMREIEIYEIIYIKVKQLFKKMIKKECDLTHSFYLKFFHIALLEDFWFLDEVFSSYYAVLYDEAQDADPVMVDILNKIPQSKVVIIGDDHQNIYAFRKTINALRNMKSETNLSLTINFRSTQKILDYANSIIKHLKSDTKELRSNTKEFNIDVIETKTEAFLTRTNASIIEYIVNEGKDKKIRFLRKVDEIFSLPIDIYERFFSNKQVKIHRILNIFYSLEEFEKYANQIQNIEYINAISLVKKYKEKIKEAYDIAKKHENKKYKEDEAITVATVHSAKGKEWDKVRLANDFKTISEIFSTLAKNNIDFDEYLRIVKSNPEENQIVLNAVQEINLLYVAITRAKSKLDLPLDLENDLRNIPLAIKNAYRRNRKYREYREPLRQENIPIIDHYKNEIDGIKIAISILLNNFETKSTSEKNRKFNLLGISLNKNNLVEICKKYLLNSDKLSDSELGIIRLIKNYYQKIEHEFNIFELYEISKVKDRELDKIFEMIKKLKLDLSNVDLVFPYIITLVELDEFYLIYDNFDINNIHKDIDIIEFIIEKNPEIFKYWAKVLGKEKLKNILYNSSKEDITDFLISKVFSKEELKDILYETIEVKKESITDFLISKVFSKKELKDILYEAIEAKKESITDFLISKVFSKKELKDILYEAIEAKKQNIINFLISKVFSQKELKEILKVFSKEELKDILYETIEVKKESITDFLISKVFSKKELKDILYEAIEAKKESITDFLVSKVFSKKELKDILYEAIEAKKQNIINFLISKVFSQKELKEILKVFSKEELKDILYETIEVKKESITDFLVSKVFSKKELKEILYEAIEAKKESITDFLISKVFSKKELKDILYEAIEVKKESITDFLVSKVFSKKELKDILYEAIEAKKESITDFLVSKVFSKKELKEMLYESIESKKENITNFLVSKVFSKKELKDILYESIETKKENITNFLILKIFNQKELKEILYESIEAKKESITNFLFSKVFSKKELKDILYELMEAKKENITVFLISKVFSKMELKEILYQAIETKKENITDFLVSKVFSKEELKSILYESIRKTKKAVIGFLVSKVFDKMELKEILYQAIEKEQKDIVDFLVFQVFNKQEIQQIFDEFLNKSKLKTIAFLISNLFDNNKIEELFNKDILDKLVKVKDEYNRTILHYAVLQNKIDLVKFLLSNYWKQIDVDLIDNFGYTAKDYAQNNKIITKIFNYFKAFRKLNSINIFILSIFSFITIFLLWKLFVLLTSLFYKDNSFSVVNNVLDTIYWLFFNIIALILYIFILFPFVKLILRRIYDKEI